LAEARGATPLAEKIETSESPIKDTTGVVGVKKAISSCNVKEVSCSLGLCA
jgi:hypothetical protein